jgi:hypothetical protein
MKALYKLTLLLILINSSCLSGQDGFIKTFRVGGEAVSFEDIHYDSTDASLVVIGRAREPEISNQGLYLMRLDTFGNILNDTLILDSLDRFFLSYTFLPSLVSSSREIWAVGSYLGCPFVHVLRFNSNFDLIDEIILPDGNDINGPLYNNIIELDDGFILHQSKQHTSFRVKNHLVKLDKEGNILWEKEYGENNIDYSSISNSSLIDSLIIITGSQFDGAISPYVMKIDLEGNLIEEIIFDELGDLEVIHLGALNEDIGGNFILETSLTTLWPNNNGPKSKQLEISKYTSDFDLNWNRQFGPDLQWALSDLPTISLDEEDNIIVSGNLVADDGAANPSILMKLSPNGETIWERRDTIFISEMDDITDFTTHKTKKHIMLLSGSIVMVGSLQQSESLGSKRFGYVIKVDKDGCIEPECREVVNIEDSLFEYSDIRIFPNPSSGLFTIIAKEKCKVDIYDFLGQKINSSDILRKQHSFDLLINPDGIYFCRISKGNSAETLKLVKSGN